MSFPTQHVVCQLLRDGPPKRGDKIPLNFMDCAYQNNNDDCGLYAIANAVANATALNKMKCNCFLPDHGSPQILMV